MSDAARLVDEFYDGTAEKDWPAWATEAVAVLGDLPKPPPEGKRERMAFYEDAMRDPKNHGALALELAYLREKVDSAGGKDMAQLLADFEAWHRRNSNDPGYTHATDKGRAWLAVSALVAPRCPACHGSGRGNLLDVCGRCKGSGGESS